MAIHTVFHLLLLVAMPPLLLGVVTKTKAAFAGRVGPPVFQLYYDLAKLLRKEMVISRATTGIFLAGPVVGLVTALAAGILVPLGHHAPPVSFQGDMIFFAFLFSLGRLFTVLAALDTGSPFEGMGAAREVTFAWLAEPAIFLGLVALARMTRSLSLGGMLGGNLLDAHPSAPGVLLLILAGWFVVLLAENCRIPFDDPNTHLELTMIHEVMALDHSGPALAAILYGAAVKFFVFGALLVGLVLPVGAGPWLDWLLFASVMLGLAVLVGTVESIMARLRLVNVPKLLVSASIATAFAVVFLLR